MDENGGVYVMLLGSVQDGGFPHVGCRCVRCARARAEPSQRRYVTSAAIVDARGEETAVYLLDVSPDISHQLEMVGDALGEQTARPNRLRQPRAVFLTHAHMGHIAGLPQLSMEGMFVRGLPLYASARLGHLLQETVLWQPLVSELLIRELVTGEAVWLADGLSVTPTAVPHRDEWGTGTFGFLVSGPSQSIFYAPDIDSWAQWSQAREVLSGVDVAIVDGAFFSAAELPGRDPVAHALVPETLTLWRDWQLEAQLVLTHLNHTNPLLDEGSAAVKLVREAGGIIGRAGQCYSL